VQFQLFAKISERVDSKLLCFVDVRQAVCALEHLESDAEGERLAAIFQGRAALLNEHSRPLLRFSDEERTLPHECARDEQNRDPDEGTAYVGPGPEGWAVATYPFAVKEAPVQFVAHM